MADVSSAPDAAAAPPIGLVAIDLDGTLLTCDKKLSLRCVRAIDRAQRQGVAVVIASARPPRAVREIYRLLGLDTVQINYNGALIHDAPRKRHIFHRPLPVPLARHVTELARRMDGSIAVSLEILDRWYTDHIVEGLETETSRSFDPDSIAPLHAYLNRPITKLMLLAPPERLAPVRECIGQRFEGQIGLAFTDPHLIQVHHPGACKARALERVARMYGVDRANVMAIGDAPNDESMLRWAGWGVAVANAWPQARNAAKAIVPSNDEDGVAFAIERYVLGEGP